MLIWFKVVVAVAGTPGPLLGDGTDTTVTMLLPDVLTEANDTLGSRSSVINSATDRKHFAVSRLQIYALDGNGADVYVGARGSVAANMIPLASAQGLPPLGSGLTENVDLGSLDIDADTNGEGFLIVAETL